MVYTAKKGRALENIIENMNSFTFIEGEVSWTERMLIQLVEDWSGKKEIAKRY